MASKNGATLSQIVKRSLSASTQPNVKKSLKSFSEIPGLSKKMLITGMLTADLRKGLENNQALWDTYGDMVRIEIPLKPPILILYDPDHCETVYRAAGSQPIRPGFDALR